MAGEGDGASLRLGLRERLQRRAALQRLSDKELVRRFKPRRATAAERREGIDTVLGDQEALRVWQNRDPVARARPGGGGMFSFVKPIARPLAKAVWTATATAIGGKLLTGQAGPINILGTSKKTLITSQTKTPGWIPKAAPLKPLTSRGIGATVAHILPQSVPTLEKPVSLLADIGAFAGNISRAVSAFRGSGPGGFGTPPISSHPGRNPTIVLPPVGTPVTQASMIPALGNILRSPVVRGAASGAAASIGIGMLDGAPRKRRRMNPLNAKAARRAIRRIKAVRKITRDIERSLPTRTVRRATPAGHRSRLSHK